MGGENPTETALKKKIADLESDAQKKEEAILKAHARNSGSRNEWTAYMITESGHIQLRGRGI